LACSFQHVASPQHVIAFENQEARVLYRQESSC